MMDAFKTSGKGGDERRDFVEMVCQYLDGDLTQDGVVRFNADLRQNAQRRAWFVGYCHQFQMVREVLAQSRASAEELWTPPGELQGDASASRICLSDASHAPATDGDDARTSLPRPGAIKRHSDAKAKTQVALPDTLSAIRAAFGRLRELTRRPTPLSVSAALLVMLAVLTALSWIYLDRRPQKDAEGVVDAARPNAVAVAWLAAVDQCQWQRGERAWQPGDRIVEGDRLVLERGLARITFDTGATALLQGRARLRLNGCDAATLVEGKVTVRVPEGADGLAVDTPAVQVVDLGTEFGVHVEPSTATLVQVFEGTVEIRPSQSNGAGEREVYVLHAGQALRFDALGVSEPEEPQQRFVRRLRPPPTLLARDRVAFWSFDKSNLADSSGSVPPNDGHGNSAPRFSGDTPFGTGRSLILDGRDDWVDVGQSAHGLYRDGKAHELTVALWMKPDLANFQGRNRGFLVTKWKNGAREFWLDVQKDGSVTFQIAQEHDGSHGAGVTIDRVVSDRCWSHIAAVFRGGAFLRVYYNGRLASEKTADVPNHFRVSGAMLRVGQDSELRNAKGFKGRMDDVVIWRRALSAYEVRLLCDP